MYKTRGKLARVGNFHSNNYIKYESNGDRNKTLSIKEYLMKLGHTRKMS